MEKAGKNLIIFDFDNTLVDGNTDMVVLDMIPRLNLRKLAHNYADDPTKGWGEAMCFALQELHKNGLGKKEIDNCLLKLEFFINGSFLNEIGHTRNNDIIIVSHSNDYFIDVLLKKVEASSAIKDVLTYPATWTANGRLQVDRFHEEIIQCKYCSGDFCKGLFILICFI
eukprot:gene3713-4233_t